MCNLASIRVTMSYRAKQDLIETSLFPPRQVFLSLISITNARSTCVKHPQLDATGRCLLADVCQSRSRFCRKSQTEASASEQTKVKKHFQIHTNEQTRGILLIVVVDPKRLSVKRAGRVSLLSDSLTDSRIRLVIAQWENTQSKSTRQDTRCLITKILQQASLKVVGLDSSHHQAEALRRRGCQPVTVLQDNEVACGSRTAVGMLIRRQTSEEGEPRPVINGLTVQCTRRLNIEESPEQPEWPWWGWEKGRRRTNKLPVNQKSDLRMGKSEHETWHTPFFLRNSTTHPPTNNRFQNTEGFIKRARFLFWVHELLRYLNQRKGVYWLNKPGC